MLKLTVRVAVNDYSTYTGETELTTLFGLPVLLEYLNNLADNYPDKDNTVISSFAVLKVLLQKSTLKDLCEQQHSTKPGHYCGS